jgi:SNF2 family DNA or RNA helicase
MVVDEAHFIKNKTSQRSQHVLACPSASAPDAAPLLMALTGTPLINDIEDFRPSGSSSAGSTTASRSAS